MKSKASKPEGVGEQHQLLELGQEGSQLKKKKRLRASRGLLRICSELEEQR